MCKKAETIPGVMDGTTYYMFLFQLLPNPSASCGFRPVEGSMLSFPSCVCVVLDALTKSVSVRQLWVRVLGQMKNVRYSSSGAAGYTSFLCAEAARIFSLVNQRHRTHNKSSEENITAFFCRGYRFFLRHFLEITRKAKCSRIARARGIQNQSRKKKHD